MSKTLSFRANLGPPGFSPSRGSDITAASWGLRGCTVLWQVISNLSWEPSWGAAGSQTPRFAPAPQTVRGPGPAPDWLYLGLFRSLG